MESLASHVFEDVAEKTEACIGVDRRLKSGKVGAQLVESVNKLWICSVSDFVVMVRMGHIPSRVQRVSEVAPWTGRAQGAMSSGWIADEFTPRTDLRRGTSVKFVT